MTKYCLSLRWLAYAQRFALYVYSELLQLALFPSDGRRLKVTCLPLQKARQTTSLTIEHELNLSMKLGGGEAIAVTSSAHDLAVTWAFFSDMNGLWSF